MDMEEIRYLLGGTVFARAKAYTDRIQDLNCEVAGNGVRHLSADVRGRRAEPVPDPGLAAGKWQLCQRQLLLPLQRKRRGALLQAHRRAADVGQRESGPFRQSAAEAIGEPGEHPGRGAGHGQSANAPA